MGIFFKILKRIIASLLVGCLIIFILLAVKKFQEIKKVEGYRQQVATYFPNDTEQTQLVLAIILTESKGKGTDIMQSSESAYNETGKITDIETSLKQGIAHLEAVEDKTSALGLDKWAGIQAYNFGLGYLDFLKEQGATKTSVKLAETYSKEVLSPLLGNDEKDTYRYYHWRSFVFNGGYLYKNGGNFFYSELVKANLRFIQWYEKIFL